MIIRRLKREHWALGNGGDFADKDMSRFFSHMGLDAEFGYGAYQDGQLAGLLRYNEWNQDVLSASGTYVAESHRGRGIARRLWLAALRYKKWKAVEVDTISPGGNALVESVVGPYCLPRNIKLLWGKL